MSDTPAVSDQLDLREQIARIDRNQAEIQKLLAEASKFKREVHMLIRRQPAAVFNLFRSQMLAALRQWIIDSKPTHAEIDAEINATISAMRQIAENGCCR